MTATVKAETFSVDVRYVPPDKMADIFMSSMMGDPAGFLDISEMRLIDSPGFEVIRRHPAHPKNLEQLYVTYQSTEGTDDERCAQLGARSMNIGDAFVIEGRTYYVMNGENMFGFKTKDGMVVVTEDNYDTDFG